MGSIFAQEQFEIKFCILATSWKVSPVAEKIAALMLIYRQDAMFQLDVLPPRFAILVRR